MQSLVLLDTNSNYAGGWGKRQESVWGESQQGVWEYEHCQLSNQEDSRSNSTLNIFYGVLAVPCMVWGKRCPSWSPSAGLSCRKHRWMTAPHSYTPSKRWEKKQQVKIKLPVTATIKDQLTQNINMHVRIAWNYCISPRVHILEYDDIFVLPICQHWKVRLLPVLIVG